MMSKQELRTHMLRERRALPAAEKARLGETIVARLRESPEVQVASVIAGYWPLLDEVDIRLFLQDCQRQGKIITLPTLPYRDIAFRKINRLSDEMTAVDAPPFDESSETIPLGAIELAIVPVVAFDDRCNRLGRGSGYYDQLIATQPYISTIGVAYELQKVSQIPVESLDQSLDTIITESTQYILKNNQY